MINYIKEKIRWWKTLCRIVKYYDADRESLSVNIEDGRNRADWAVDIANAAEKVIRERTSLNVDMHCHRDAANQIIMIGRYNGQDYIQTYRIDSHGFNEMMSIVKEMERYAYVDKIDAMPSMRYVIDKELKW